MVTSRKIKQPKTLRILSLAIVVSGFIFRFYHQFIHWTFNTDAVSLGTDILSNKFPALIKPFESFQSSPPLFLLLQKLVSYIEPHYFSLKVLSFLSSCLAIIFFKKIIEKNGISIFSICLLLIFTFNPFVLYHSLTLKQYTFDLSLALISIHYFWKQRPFFQTFIFFGLWCLISNVGLFFSAAFILNIFYQNFFPLQDYKFKTFIKSFFYRALPFILAPGFYIIFFIWYMGQPGAMETKEFMTNYWEIWFLPLNEDFFWWTGVQLYRMMFFFFSTYIIVGVLMLIGMFYGIYVIFKNNRGNKFLVQIYLLAVGIHLILSAIQIYPFSDRLYLYMAPLVLYLSLLGLYSFLINLGLNKIFFVIFTVVLLILNSTYLGYKENDILLLSKKLQKFEEQTAYRTLRANHHIEEWVKFTNYPYLSKELVKSANQTNLDSLKANDLIISRVYRKFGHGNRTDKIEETLQIIQAEGRLEKVIEVDGYNVYLVN